MLNQQELSSEVYNALNHLTNKIADLTKTLDPQTEETNIIKDNFLHATNKLNEIERSIRQDLIELMGR